MYRRRFVTSKLYISPIVASAVVRFKAVVLLLLAALIVCGSFVFGPSFVMQ